MKGKGVIFHATEEASKSYNESIKEKKKTKKVRCPQCEIDLRNKKAK